MAYHLSTEGVWYRCLERYIHAGENSRRIPVTVTLAELPPGVYSIEIANDLSRGWLIEAGLLQSRYNTCGKNEYPGYASISTDSFTVVAPVTQPPPAVETPSSPPSPPVASPPAQGAPLPAQGPLPSPTKPTLRCRSGYTQARIGGHLTCLHAGESCIWRYRHQYKRYHYACVTRGRKFRLVRRR